MHLFANENIQGRVRAYTVENQKWQAGTEFKPNLVLYQWAEIVAKLLTTGDSRYRIGGMLIEYVNVANPAVPAPIPSFGRDRTVQYYKNLASSANSDYLRVPLTATQITSAGTGLQNNVINFFARTSGTSGVNGKAFSYAANSIVIGAALVAFTEAGGLGIDDLILSSFYFNSADQQRKLATSQVGIEWELALQ